MEHIYRHKTKSVIEQLFKEFLAMPYIQNSSVNVGFSHRFFKNKFFQFIFATIQFIINYLKGKTHKHEDKIEEILHSYDFEKITLEEAGLTKDDVVNGLRFNTKAVLYDATNRYYIPQPLGSVRSPDFVIIYEDRCYYLECKSGKLDIIRFNNSLPRDEYIYLFTCERYNKTIIFLGRDVMNDLIRDKYSVFMKEIRILEKEFNEDLLKEKTNNHGWTIYWRNNFEQRGKNGVTAWVKHKNIDKYIENVMGFIK